jgi:hypothetical protein
MALGDAAVRGGSALASLGDAGNSLRACGDTSALASGDSLCGVASVRGLTTARSGTTSLSSDVGTDESVALRGFGTGSSLSLSLSCEAALLRRESECAECAECESACGLASEDGGASEAPKS